VSPPQQWGGGGGFGPPPGGGGGFGPPPGGGGGFGPPPGGGGGFGPPPGGGGGYAPPGGSPPGDAPLGRIPFSPDDEKNITQTVLFMRIAGAIAIVSSLFSMVGTVGVGLYRSLPIGGSICGGLIGLAVQASLGAMLLVSSNAFSRIASTDGADQHHLATGLRQLRWYFLVKSILWLLGLLLCCACVVLGLVFGAALMSMIAGVAASQ